MTRRLAAARASARVGQLPFYQRALIEAAGEVCRNYSTPTAKIAGAARRLLICPPDRCYADLPHRGPAVVADGALQGLPLFSSPGTADEERPVLENGLAFNEPEVYRSMNSCARIFGRKRGLACWLPR